MDASDGANKNGNGQHAPDPVSLPSAALPPAGGPVSSSPEASPAAAATPPEPAAEPLVVVDNDKPKKPVDPARDPVTGRIRKGHTLNPEGKHGPMRFRNPDIYDLVNSKELREVWKIAKDKAKKGDYKLVEFFLERVTIKATAENVAATGGVVIHNHPTATASAGSSSSSTNDRREELRDPGIVDALGDLADRIAERRRVARAAGGNGN